MNECFDLLAAMACIASWSEQRKRTKEAKCAVLVALCCGIDPQLLQRPLQGMGGRDQESLRAICSQMPSYEYDWPSTNRLISWSVLPEVAATGVSMKLGPHPNIASDLRAQGSINS